VENYIIILHRCGNSVIHVIVLVFTESAAKEDVVFGSKFPVFLIKSIVALIVERIIGLITDLPVGRILSCHNRTITLAELEMLMLDYSGIGSLRISVIDYCIALIVFLAGNIL